MTWDLAQPRGHWGGVGVISHRVREGGCVWGGEAKAEAGGATASAIAVGSERQQEAGEGAVGRTRPGRHVGRRRRLGVVCGQGTGRRLLSEGSRQPVGRGLGAADNLLLLFLLRLCCLCCLFLEALRRPVAPARLKCSWTPSGTLAPVGRGGRRAPPLPPHRT